MQNVEIETERILLREIVPEDWLPMAEYYSDPDYRRHLLGSQRSSGQAFRWVTRTISAARQRPRSYYGLAVTLRNEGRFIGICSIGIGLDAPVASRTAAISGNMGWEIGKPYWGRGYATEAAHALALRLRVARSRPSGRRLLRGQQSIDTRHGKDGFAPAPPQRLRPAEYVDLLSRASPDGKLRDNPSRIRLSAVTYPVI